MLGGLNPVIIFQFSEILIDPAPVVESIPVTSRSDLASIQLPPIPVYLSEQAFNIALGGVSKSVDIQTVTDGKTDGGVDTNQNPIQSSVEINIVGKQDSVALTLLSALIDRIYEKVTSKEYSISFLYGATTIFRALLHSYTCATVEGTDKLEITIKLSRGEKTPVKKDAIPSVAGVSGTSIGVGL